MKDGGNDLNKIVHFLQCFCFQHPLNYYLRDKQITTAFLMETSHVNGHASE
jgi:hypothetical protein